MLELLKYVIFNFRIWIFTSEVVQAKLLQMISTFTTATTEVGAKLP